jgi:hypothetical protein
MFPSASLGENLKLNRTRGKTCFTSGSCPGRSAARRAARRSCRQVGATRRAGRFLAVSRAFLSSGVPERAPGGRGWPGLAGWMKAQIRAKSRNRGRDWAVFRRPDENKGCRGPRRACGWRCSNTVRGRQPGESSRPEELLRKKKSKH